MCCPKALVCIGKRKCGWHTALVSWRKSCKIQAARNDSLLDGRRKHSDDESSSKYLQKAICRALASTLGSRMIFGKRTAIKERNVKAGRELSVERNDVFVLEKETDGEDSSSPAPLLYNILRKITEAFRIRVDREREIERLKQQLNKRRQSLPGYVSNIVGYVSDENVKRYSFGDLDRARLPTSQPSRFVYQACPGQCLDETNTRTPPTTPQHWQYPYGCQIPTSAIPEAGRSQRHYRKDIALHNAKYRSNRNVRVQTTFRQFTSGPDATNESPRYLSGALVDNAEAHVKYPDARGFTNGTSMKINPIEKQIARSNMCGKVEETSAKNVSVERAEMEKRLGQTPDLLAGLGIYLESPAACNNKLTGFTIDNEEEVDLLEGEIMRLNCAFSWPESSPKRRIWKQDEKLNNIGTHVLKTVRDLHVYRTPR